MSNARHIISVLLENEAGALSRVAVLGTLAAQVNLGDGGSSEVWPPEITRPVKRSGIASARSPSACRNGDTRCPSMWCMP